MGEEGDGKEKGHRVRGSRARGVKETAKKMERARAGRSGCPQGERGCEEPTCKERIKLKRASLQQLMDGTSLFHRPPAQWRQIYVIL